MLLRRCSSLAILMLALSGTGAIAATEALPGDRFEQIVAQGGPGGGGGRGNSEGRGGKLDRWIQELNLTADQQQEIQRIREDSRDDIEPLRNEIRQAREEMRNLMSSNPSDGDLRSQHRQMQELHREMSNLRFEQMLKVRRILTEEQRRELAEKMQQRWDDRENGQGQGRRQGRRQGGGQR